MEVFFELKLVTNLKKKLMNTTDKECNDKKFLEIKQRFVTWNLSRRDQKILTLFIKVFESFLRAHL